MSGRAILGHSVLFFLGNTLPQVAALFLLPLYTHHLTPQEFGVLEILNRLGELFIICLLFNGLRQAVVVFSGLQSTGNDPAALGPSFLCTLAGLVLLGLFLGWLCRPAVQLLVPDADADLCLLALATVLVDGAFTALLCLAQARMESGLFVVSVAFQVALRVVLGVLFVAVAGWGLWGVLASGLLASAVACLGLATRELLRRPGRFKLGAAWHMVRFALPFVPAGLGFFILNHGDRFLLLHSAGEATVGVYALGYKIALAVSMFSRAPLMMAWGPRAYRLADAPEAPVLFGQVFVRILGAYVAVGLGCCLFQDEVVGLLGSHAYAPASLVVAPIVLAYFFLAAADFMDCSFYVRRKTTHKSLVALVTTVVMMLAYLVLIPLWSITGAAAATLAGFVFHAALTYLVSRRVFPIHYRFARIALILGLALAVWFASRLLPANLVGAGLKLVLWCCWVVLLWVCGLITADEKEWVRQTVWQQLEIIFCFARSRSARNDKSNTRRSPV
jgi:O-antigen/teichoic acid export membrane protein